MSAPQDFSEEELAQLEAEMEKLTPDDILIQTLVTLINLGARKAGWRRRPASRARSAISSRPEQAIEGARAIIPLLEPRHARGAGRRQGRAVAAADGLRAAFRRDAAAAEPSAPEPAEARARPVPAQIVRAALGSRPVSRAVDSPRSYGGPLGPSFRFV